MQLFQYFFLVQIFIIFRRIFHSQKWYHWWKFRKFVRRIILFSTCKTLFIGFLPEHFIQQFLSFWISILHLFIFSFGSYTLSDFMLFSHTLLFFFAFCLFEWPNLIFLFAFFIIFEGLFAFVFNFLWLLGLWILKILIVTGQFLFLFILLGYFLFFVILKTFFWLVFVFFHEIVR